MSGPAGLQHFGQVAHAQVSNHTKMGGVLTRSPGSMMTQTKNPSCNNH